MKRRIRDEGNVDVLRTVIFFDCLRCRPKRPIPTPGELSGPSTRAKTIGDSHGDIAVSLDGKLIIFVNVNEVVPGNFQERQFPFFRVVRMTGVAVFSDDRIFVTDGYGTSRIFEFDQQGR
jgi:hypothetical protein